MANSMPSMGALLGLLAIAGYKNRDKLSDLLKSAKQSLPKPQVEELDTMFAGDKAGDNLSGGLGALIESFNKGGNQATTDSWIGSGPNQDLPASKLEQAIGGDMLSDLAAKTGMSKEDILARLSTNLPGAIDGFTPDGRLPNAREAAGFR